MATYGSSTEPSKSNVSAFTTSPQAAEPQSDEPTEFAGLFIGSELEEGSTGKVVGDVSAGENTTAFETRMVMEHSTRREQGTFLPRIDQGRRRSMSPRFG